LAKTISTWPPKLPTLEPADLRNATCTRLLFLPTPISKTHPALPYSVSSRLPLLPTAFSNWLIPTLFSLPPVIRPPFTSMPLEAISGSALHSRQSNSPSLTSLPQPSFY